MSHWSDLVPVNLSALCHFQVPAILIAGIIAALGLDLFAAGKNRRTWISAAAIAFLLLASAAGARGLGQAAVPLFNGLLAADPFAAFFAFFLPLVGAAVLAVGHASEEFEGKAWGEIVFLILVVTLGMILLAASTDWLMLYLSLELVSVPSYVLVGLRRRDALASFSAEAALKYVLYGALCSALALFGISIFFALTGQTSLNSVAALFAPALWNSAYAPALVLACLAVLIGLGFKISMFPVQMWAPDVYQGAPTAISAFLSVAPKAAGFAILFRIFYPWLAEAELLRQLHFPTLIAILSALTMTVGNLAALRQISAKRLLAYSSIAQAGYILMGLATFTPLGVKAALLYLAIYAAMNLGAFFVVQWVIQQSGRDEVAAFAGLGWRNPGLAFLMALFLVSLVGLPPLAGFVGKFFLFAAAIEGHLGWLAVIAVLNSVVSLFYYARFLRCMYLEKVPGPALAVPPLSCAVGSLLGLFVIALGIFWQPLEKMVKISIQLIR